MPNMLSRRYAALGWVVWKLAKRRLRQKVRAEGEGPRRRRVLRAVGAVAALAALAAVWSKRARGVDDRADEPAA